MYCHTNICMATPNICMAMQYMYGHSFINFIFGYLLQIFQDLYIIVMVEYLKDNL